MKQNKRLPTNQLVISGYTLILLLLPLSMIKSKTSLTTFLNIACGFGGAGLLFAGSIQEYNQRKNK